MGSQKPLNELEPNVGDDDGNDGGKARSSARESRRKKRPPSARAENDLRDRLSACLERIATTLETRGDEQLADVIREDAETMAGGLVFLTRPFKMLRSPLLVALAVVEPAISFGRVGRVVAERMVDRRARRAEERALNAQEQGNEGNDGNA